MARGKKVSPAERRNWLRQFEQGTSVSEIAKKAKRAASAVRTHIDVARQDQEQGNARAHLTWQAYEDHYGDLLGFAEEIRMKAATWLEGQVSLPADIRSRLLLQGLRQHAPNSPLWSCWDDILARSLELNQIEAEIKSELVQVAGKAYPEINVDGVAASILTRFRLSPELDSDLESWYRIEDYDERFSLHWGAHLAASGVTDETRIQEIRSWHTSLIENRESMTIDLIERYRNLLVDGGSMVGELDEEVERLLLRRILPGRCSICPDAAPGRATRARKTQISNPTRRSQL